MTDKPEKTKNKKIEFFRPVNDSGFENRVEEIWCGGIDAEIENIFDDLRLIGDPQNQTLDEVLGKAIALEKKSLEQSPEAAHKNSFADKLKFFPAAFRQLQIPELMICLLLTVMAVSIIKISTPVQANSESIAGGVNKSRIDFR